MIQINNIPIIKYVYDKINRSKKINKIIIATSTHKSDFKLVNYLKRNNILFFKGNLNNVAKRLLDCANKYNSKFFIRISGDSPFIDYKLINKAINIFNKNKSFDIITNVFPRTFPKGMSIELIRTSILKNNLKLMTSLEKEHVTKYFYDNVRKFKIYNFRTRKKISEHFAIDTPNDLKRLRKRFVL